MTTRVLVLGAGASRFACYPLADFWPFVRDRRSNDPTKKEAEDEVIAVMERIFPLQQDLEELFTLLELGNQCIKRLLREDVNWLDLRPKLVGMICWAFLSHEDEFQKKVRQGCYADVLGNWTDFIKPGDAIITFNWDILHEAALWRAGKWCYADGYGFPCSDPTLTATSPTKILKLHGSVNWAQNDESDFRPEIEDKAHFFPGARDGASTYRKRQQSDGGRKLVIPTYLKEVASNRLLLQLWNQAAEALASADEVIVIGYRLNPADALARYLLGSTLLRNARLKKISLVDPNPITERWDESALPINHWDDFAASIGKREKLKLIWKKFEGWVLDGCKT